VDGGLIMMKMSNLVFIKHKELTDEMLQIICEIKTVAWNYSLIEQKKWILKNIEESDIHVLLKKNGVYAAYLNLININLLNSNNMLFNSLGIGNVCTRFEKKGYGSILIQGVNQYLLNDGKSGMLFCKKQLVNFYERNGYKIENEDEENIFFMSFNNDCDKFLYNGKPF